MSTAKKIKSLRLALCLSMHDFAKALQVSVSSVSLWENDHREPGFASMRKMLAMAKKNGIKLDFDLRTE